MPRSLSELNRASHRRTFLNPARSRALLLSLVFVVALLTTVWHIQLRTIFSSTSGLGQLLPAGSEGDSRAKWEIDEIGESSYQSSPIESEEMSGSSKLQDFLRRCKEEVKAKLSGQQSSGRRLVLIMGNGAGDLDSLTSAISLAYFLTNLPHKSLPFASSSSLPPDAVFAPLIQTNRSDAKLRPENIAAVATSGLAQEDLLYLSDLTDEQSQGGLGLNLAESAELSPSSGVYLGLVDHPQLELSWLGKAERHVSLIVDHHADAGKHQDAALRIYRQPDGAENADPTGSAQSIVVELFADAIKANEGVVERGLADLCMSTVLIDTDNLRPMPRGRASKTDFAAMDLLLPLSSFASATSATKLRESLLSHAPQEVASTASDFSAASFDESVSADIAGKTESVWSVLAASKAAISHLSSIELLKRDYKTSSLSSSDLPSSLSSLLPDSELRAGFSSVNLGLPTWLHRGKEVDSEAAVEEAWKKWWAALHEWMEMQRLTVAVVGTSFRDEEKDKHRRELVLAFAPPSTLKRPGDFFKAVAHELQSSSSTLDLELPWKGARIVPTDKRERVWGFEISGSEEKRGGGKLSSSALGGGGGGNSVLYAQVWKQANTKANRKVYLPAIMSALKKAAAAL